MEETEIHLPATSGAGGGERLPRLVPPPTDRCRGLQGLAVDARATGDDCSHSYDQNIIENITQ